jgi:hypothetical protein
MSGTYIPVPRRPARDLNQRRRNDEGNLMNERYELFSIRSDDYVAKLLEREADLLPPGFEDSANILLQQAKSFRESTRTETIKISKHVADKLGFISR